MEEIKKRLEFADIIKGLAIILVVIGHTSPSNTEVLTYKSIIYAFHMPLFFIVSGFFITTNRVDYSLQTLKNFLHKNCIALLVPFFIWGLIYMDFSYTNLLSLCFGSWIKFVSINTLTSLWFIVILFVGRIYLELFFMLINKLKFNLKYAIYIAIPIFFSLGFCLPHHNNVQTQIGNFFSYDIAFVSAAFMLIGSILKPYIEKLTTFKSVHLIFWMIVSVLLFWCGFSLIDYTHEFVLIANAIYLNPFLFVLNSLTGSFIIILLGILIQKTPSKHVLLNFLGTNTLGIYLTHRHIVVWLLKYLQANTDFSRSLINTIITFIALILSSILVILINRYAPIMFGKINRHSSDNIKC